MNEILNFNRLGFEDYYKLLGCSIHSTEEQIQKEYRIRALELHPDKNIENQELCNVKFQKLKKAKEILLDKDKRILYDKWLLSGIMMSFEQFSNYTKSNCQSFHWANKKLEPMLTYSHDQNINQQNLDSETDEFNLNSISKFGLNFFRNESNDLLEKFRNYEI